MVPTTFVDDAEFVWKEAEHGKTQFEIAEILGWGLDKVKKYSVLRQIHPDAWNIIVPTFENLGTHTQEDGGTTKVPGGTFTENLLRDILDLPKDQQLELVQALASESINKGKFKAQAEAYHTRNQMYAGKRIVDISNATISLQTRPEPKRSPW